MKMHNTAIIFHTYSQFIHFSNKTRCDLVLFFSFAPSVVFLGPEVSWDCIISGGSSSTVHNEGLKTNITILAVVMGFYADLPKQPVQIPPRSITCTAYRYGNVYGRIECTAMKHSGDVCICNSVKRKIELVRPCQVQLHQDDDGFTIGGEMV